MTLRSSFWRRGAFAAAALTACGGVGAVAWQGQIVAQEQGVKQSPAHNAAHEHAKALSLAFRQTAEATVPTVVTVMSHAKSRPVRGTQRNENPLKGRENPFKGTPFEDFFNDQNSPFNSPGFTPRREGMGSGVIIDKSGLILTNNHVVEGADEVTVRLSDGREFEATDIRTDKDTDLAIVRIKGAGTLPAAPLGDSEKINVGDWVIAVGNPFNQESTVSAGIISGKGRTLSGHNQRSSYIQTDAAINPGNSGGPLVNLDGEVIGINTAIASNNGGFQGVGFAVPINEAKWVVKQLSEKGSVQRAYLGVSIGQLNSDMAEQFGVKPNEGLVVGEVIPKSPAAEAGFQEGDLITEFAGKPVHKPRDLQSIVEQSAPGEKHEAKLLRAGKPMTLMVTVKPLPTEARVAAEHEEKDATKESSGPSYQAKDWGFEVTDLTPDMAEQFGYQDHKGVVITGVNEDGVAAERGLREGMLVKMVGNQRVTNVDEFKSAMARHPAGKDLMLLVRSGQNQTYIVLKK